MLNQYIFLFLTTQKFTLFWLKQSRLEKTSFTANYHSKTYTKAHTRQS